MNSIQSKLQYVGKAFSEAVPASYHYFRLPDRFPCLVWQEDGENGSFHANNHKEEQAIHGTTDYFTQTEWDPAVDLIQATLENIGAAWTLNSVQYEEETRLIHYEWDWTVIDVEEEEDGQI